MEKKTGMVVIEGDMLERCVRASARYRSSGHVVWCGGSIAREFRMALQAEDFARRENARALLAELRNPTPEMIDAAGLAILSPEHAQTHVVTVIWQAMIDSITAEPEMIDAAGLKP